MKGKLISIMAMVLALLVWVAPGAQAATTYSGAWAPNEIILPTAAIDLTLSATGTGSLYLYEYGDTSNSILLLTNNNLLDFMVGIGFEFVSNAWTAISMNPITNVTQTLTMNDGRTLVDGPIFGLYFTSDNTPNSDPYTIEYISLTDAYKITDPISTMMVEVKNASPVPLPGTAALFVPCILGILGVGWRKNRNA